MKSITLIACFVFSCTFFKVQGVDTDAFFAKYPGNSYQDINICNEIFPTGTDLCSNRYDLIKPILNALNKPFNVLDLGAAQGYFSFSIAHDYPNSSCVMIDANTSYYSNHGNILYDLCHLNSHLKNICYLNKKMALSDLSILKKEAHFDIIFAMLVVHMMADSLIEQIKIINSLLELGDNLILEVSNNVAPFLFEYVALLSEKVDCECLGEVIRHRVEFCPYHYETCPCTGKLYWFKKKSPDRKSLSSHAPLGITEETFIKFNGVYPDYKPS